MLNKKFLQTLINTSASARISTILMIMTVIFGGEPYPAHAGCNQCGPVEGAHCTLRSNGWYSCRNATSFVPGSKGGECFRDKNCCSVRDGYTLDNCY
jgi:hypothetical protein